MIAWLTPDLTHPVANGNAMSKVSSAKSVFTTSPISRRNFTRQRRALSRRERQALGKQASLHLHKLTSHLPHCPKKKAKIGIYLDAFGELPTQPIVDWCQRQGYAVFLPVVGSLGHSPLGQQDKRLRFVPMQRKKLITLPTVPHALGMNQVSHRKLLWSTELDMIFCPLVAVDKQGNRMGMGGGYYDTTLAKVHEFGLPKPLKVGWCYDFQLVDSLPHQPWDVPMDAVVMPSGLTTF